MPNLILFSLTDLIFGREELLRLIKSLEKTQLQAMALCPTYTILNSLATSKELQLQVMHFCSGQGIFTIPSLQIKFRSKNIRLKFIQTQFSNNYNALYTRICF